jgi:hypothetical protein
LACHAIGPYARCAYKLVYCPTKILLLIFVPYIRVDQIYIKL